MHNSTQGIINGVVNTVILFWYQHPLRGLETERLMSSKRQRSGNHLRL